MITEIKTAAESVGITAVITNSAEKIETQLNRITRDGDLPIMLVSWDLNTTYSFNDSGFLDNPDTSVTILLMDKAEDTSKDELESTAESMESLYQQFLQALRELLIPYQLNYSQQPIYNINSTLAPGYGMGKHSGVVGSFVMKVQVTPCS